MISSTWGTWAADWLLDDKVSFDGVNKIIYVHPDATTFDIRADLYTSWVDWLVLYDHAKFLPAIRVTGLDPIGAGVYTGDTYFLINGWKLSINLQNTKVTGVLYSDDYDTAFYTPELVPQYPAVVSSLVTTVSTGGGSGATPAQIWSFNNRTLTSASVIKTDIESSTVLAKQVTVDSIKSKVDTLSDGPSAETIANAVRADLDSDLNSILYNTSNGALTNQQATMLLELYRLMGLDPTKPLVVTQHQRVVGDIVQQIDSTATETSIIRI